MGSHRNSSMSFLPGRLETIEESNASNSNHDITLPLPPTSQSPSGRYTRSATTVSGVVGIPPATPNSRAEITSYPGFSNYASTQDTSFKAANVQYQGPEARLLLVADTSKPSNTPTTLSNTNSSSASLALGTTNAPTTKRTNNVPSLVLTQVLITSLADIPGTR